MIKLLTMLGTLIALGWTDILEVIADMHNTGASWGAIITGLLLWNKIRNNKRLKELDERMEAKLNAIMRHRGVPWDWDAERRALNRSTDPMLYKWLHRVTYRAHTVGLFIRRRVTGLFRLRRGKRMQGINWATLLPAMFGAIKLILQPFGIDLSNVTDQQINDMANGIAALLVVGGIVYNHFKKGDAAGGPSNSVESNK